MLATNPRMAAKIYDLETRMDTHGDAMNGLIAAIEELMTPEKKRRQRIGFELPAAKRGS